MRKVVGAIICCLCVSLGLPAFATQDYLRWRLLQNQGLQALEARDDASAERFFKQAIVSNQNYYYNRVTAAELVESYKCLLPIEQRQHKQLECMLCYYGITTNSGFLKTTSETDSFDPSALERLAAVLLLGFYLLSVRDCYRMIVKARGRMRLAAANLDS